MSAIQSDTIGLPLSLEGLDIGIQATSLTGSTITTTAAMVMPQATTANAHAAAQQIASALSDPGREPGGMVELALDPPELGRLRMQMVDVAGVITLTIHAERPETADLLRRHMDLLAQEFAQAGLDAPSVQINNGNADGDGQGHPDGQPEGRAHQTLSDDPPQPSTQPQHTANGALDLRL